MWVDDTSKPARTIADTISQQLVIEDQKATPEERFNNFALALKIKQGEGEVEYTLDELAAIKKRVGESPMPVIVGRVWEALGEKPGPVKK
jgi:hypothetical protein